MRSESLIRLTMLMVFSICGMKSGNQMQFLGENPPKIAVHLSSHDRIWVPIDKDTTFAHLKIWLQASHPTLNLFEKCILTPIAAWPARQRLYQEIPDEIKVYDIVSNFETLDFVLREKTA